MVMIWPTILKCIKPHAFNWYYRFVFKHAANSIEVYYVLGKYGEESYNPYWGLTDGRWDLHWT